MTGSLAIAAPPLLVLLVLLWTFDRQAGRSGLILVASVFWGGLVATSLVTTVGALWLEQPLWYPYVAAPIAEELAKGLLFVVLLCSRLLPGIPAGLAYGLACGLGFALWENATYFEQTGGAGPSTWLYLTRTAGPALLHAVSTAVVGAAAGAGGLAPRRVRHLVAIFAALAVATWIHGGWNYICLVLSNTDATRRVLPLAGASLLLALLSWSVLEERWRLREEVLELWREGLVPEAVALAMTSRWSLQALRRLDVPQPRRLARVIWALASIRRQLRDLPAQATAVRRRVEAELERANAALCAVTDPDAEVPGAGARRTRLALVIGLAFLGVALHLLGRLSPVPATLARRTIVIGASVGVRPEPSITLMGGDTYLLWQRGPSKRSREQMLTWVGVDARPVHHSLGAIPENEPDWFEMGALGEGVAIATRQGDEIWIRAFVESVERGNLRLEATEEGPEPCWPWMTSDRGRTLLGWDRVRRVAWLRATPFGLEGQPTTLPDPFPNFDTPEQACARGFLMTDQTIYEIARPSGHSRMAAVNLERREATRLEICPGESSLRVHSLDKDRGEVLVLLGGRGRAGAGYQLHLARLDRVGQVIEPCRVIREMPAGGPAVVGLAGAGDDAFLAWSAGGYIFLERFPLREGGARLRRWVLDRAPRGGAGVVRVGVVDDRLFVAWEGRAGEGRWSLKLLRVAVGDLP